MGSLSRIGFIVGVVALLMIEAGVQWWHQRSIPLADVTRVLSLDLPLAGDGATDIPDLPEFEELDLDEIAAEILSYDEGRRLRFRGKNGIVMDINYMEHNAGNQRYVVDCYSHEPEVCMTTAGATLAATNENREFSLGGQSLRIRCLTFTEPPSDRTVFIYKLIWVPPGFDTKADPTYSAMKEIWIKRALTRTPWPPTRLILATVAGAATEQAAWEFFEQTILKRVKLIEIDSPVGDAT